MKYKIKSSYVAKLSQMQTLTAKEELRRMLLSRLVKQFNLTYVSMPLVTDVDMWLNDDYKSHFRPIDFDTYEGFYGQLIQSPNKWRRKTLTDVDLKNNEGILTDSTFVIRDIKVSNVSSLTTNEIGFEIRKDNKDKEIIKDILVGFYKTLIEIDKKFVQKFPEIKHEHFENEITFITSGQLKANYPFLSFEERINEFSKESGSFILIDFAKSLLETNELGIYSQDTFDLDYFAELYIWNPVIEQAIKLGYCGYTPDKETLKKQTQFIKETWKGDTGYEIMIKNDELYQTISTGFNFGRIVMTILEKQHIGEVIASVWDKEFLEFCAKNGITIL